jgi:hypothetical protein
MKIKLYEIILIVLNIIFYIVMINNYENIKIEFIKQNNEDKMFLFYFLHFVCIILNILLLCLFSSNFSIIIGKIFSFLGRVLSKEFKI